MGIESVKQPIIHFFSGHLIPFTLFPYPIGYMVKPRKNNRIIRKISIAAKIKARRFFFLCLVFFGNGFPSLIKWRPY